MKKVFLIIALLGFIKTFAQTKQTENINRIWLGYLNQTRLSNKWGLWLDIHARTKENFTDNLSQAFIRVGLTYYLSDVTKLTVGYAYVNDFPSDGHKNISVPEHRPWQQIQWHTKYGKNKMMQWLRLEERYRQKVLNDDALADGYNFNFRLRYNLWYEIPFAKNGSEINSWSFIVNDELHINFGKTIVNNYFDQNRFFLGLKLQTGSHSNLQFGYMNLFQQLAAGNKYRNIHTARVFFFQNLDLRTKKH